MLRSPNVEKLSHYWEALPAESMQRARYASPAVSQAPALLVLGALLGGVWIAWTGQVLWGLGVAVAALVWGVVAVGASIASQARRVCKHPSWYQCTEIIWYQRSA